MPYENACDRLCDDIADLLVNLGPSRACAAYAAACATRNLAAAMHHAAGAPQNRRWQVALESVAHFLDHCKGTRVAGSAAHAELRDFVAENLDLLTRPVEFAIAS